MFKKALLILLLLSTAAFAFTATQVLGTGPLPYNYRIIDQHIHAGGHPLNPRIHFINTNKQVLGILNYLKSKDVKTVIDLENTKAIQKRYTRLLKKAGLTRIHIPMHKDKVPTEEEWLIIKKAMKKPVYIHCKWGADRTGAILGKYLVEVKGHSSKEAFAMVKTGGDWAGPLGGLKTSKNYWNITRFFYSDYKKQ